MMPVRDTFPDQPRAVLFPITDISGAEDGGLRGKGADLRGETYSAVSKTRLRRWIEWQRCSKRRLLTLHYTLIDPISHPRHGQLLVKPEIWPGRRKADVAAEGSVLDGPDARFEWSSRHRDW